MTTINPPKPITGTPNDPPRFPNCPIWCSERDAHDPMGEVETFTGRPGDEPHAPMVILSDRRHTHVVLDETPVADADNADDNRDGYFRVELNRYDDGALNESWTARVGDTEIRIDIANVDTQVAIHPTPAEARALAAALLRAADFADGATA